MRFQALWFVVLISLVPALALAQFGSIEVSAVNSLTGEPIPGARLKLARQPGEAGTYFAPLYGRTDAQGRFQFTGLDVAAYSLNVQHPGFIVIGERRGDTEWIGTFPVRRTSATTVEAKLTPVAEITGRITNSDGSPLSGSMVQILTPVGNGGELRYLVAVRTNDNGEFHAGRLRPGTYYVRAQQGAYTDNSFPGTYFPRTLDAAAAKPLELTAGQQARADVQLMRVTGVRVAGRVTPAASSGESSPSPFRRAALRLAPRPADGTDGYSQPSASNILDAFEMREVRPGAYTLIAVTYEHGNDGKPKPLLGAAQPVEISDHDTEGLTVEMHELPDLTGSVAFAPGCTPSPVVIKLSGIAPISGFVRVETETDGQGAFMLSGLIPALYTLTASLRGSTVGSARIGSRDVLKEGLQYPAAESAPLKIELTCSNRSAQ
jgi:hypothetical protein